VVCHYTIVSDGVARREGPRCVRAEGTGNDHGAFCCTTDCYGFSSMRPLRWRVRYYRGIRPHHSLRIRPVNPATASGINNQPTTMRNNRYRRKVSPCVTQVMIIAHTSRAIAPAQQTP
jgi:hypothetical protein